MAAADNTGKLSKKHRSNSVKVAALTALKSGVSPGQISKELEIPPSTLRQWRKVSMESGDWGAAGDSRIARPAPCKRGPGTGTRNRKVTMAIKKKMKEKIDEDPFQTPRGLQKLIPRLRKVSRRTIRHLIQKEMKLPSRTAAAKPFLKKSQKVLPWVGQSPDLNPIENLWTRLKHIIGRMPAARNMDEFIKNIKISWKKLEKDTDYLDKLTHSMPKQVQAVIEAGGDITKY